jgi:tRNA A-37 threonylcarbamoyl transferase component Bud32
MLAPLTDPSLLGSLLADRYEIRAPLGRGGMGEVVEAVDRRLSRTVAIKVLHPELADDERFLARFRREAATAARLSHVGIVSVHDIGEHAGRTFIVMELVAGRTLADLGRGSDVASVGRIGAAAARALAHAHDRGVVHRDVSPANIMVTADGTVKVLDFGIARGPSASAASRGTVAYVAPEVLRGGTADARADVYSLGMVLRELASHLDDRALAGVLARATAPEPQERFVSAAAFARSLDGLDTVPEPSASPSLSDERDREMDRTQPLVRIATRPLGSAPTERSALEPARGVAVRSTRRHARRGRIVNVLVAGTLVCIALGGALLLGQVLVSMSAPQAAAVVSGPDLVPAPTGLTAVASCDGLFSTGVDLAWTGAAPVKGYEIWRGGGIDELTLVARVRGVHTEWFRDVDLGVDTSYTYRIRGFDGPRVSGWSNVVDVATPFLCLS